MVRNDVRLGMGFAAAFLLLFAAGGPVWGLGKPDWAKPYLTLPSPSGPYIAKADEWAVVYGEVEFAICEGGRFEKRTRLILENRREKAIDFTASIVFDDLQYEFSDAALNVERILWHSINLRRSALDVREKGGGIRMVFTGAETIPPKHRVVFEYTLQDKLGFFDWHSEQVAWMWPAAQIKYFLSPESASKGMSLQLVSPAGQPRPASFESQGEGIWVVSSIPAFRRIPSGLTFQPAPDRLYPFFVALLPGSGEGGWEGFARRIAGMWNETFEKVKTPAVRERALTLVKGLEDPGEKAAALARFVQREIHYDDSNERGIQAWVPLSAEESLRSMKADCKGKVLLLQALLDAAGIASQPILVRSEREYFDWGDHPGTSFVNHVIMAVQIPMGAPALPAMLREGPLKGWVLFDPTRRTSGFGEPPGGLEGVPVLCPTVSGNPFHIRTDHPATWTAEVEAEYEYAGYLGMRFKISERDNGGGALGGSLAGTFSSDDIARAVVARLSPVIGQVQVGATTVRRPAWDGVNRSCVMFEGTAAKALQEMPATGLLLNPMALAAKVAGLPNGIPPKAIIPEDEKIESAPPWDLHLNAQGNETEVRLSVRITLPSGYSWEPPKPQEVEKPWLKCKMDWKPDGPETWKGSFWLSVPRGLWPAEERKMRLKVVDELYRGLYTPLVLKKRTA